MQRRVATHYKTVAQRLQDAVGGLTRAVAAGSSTNEHAVDVESAAMGSGGTSRRYMPYGPRKMGDNENAMFEKLAKRGELAHSR